MSDRNIPHEVDNGTDFLTMNELADELRVTTRTLFRWKAQGALPLHVKVGRTLRFTRAEVDTWLAARGKGDQDAGTHQTALQRVETPGEVVSTSNGDTASHPDALERISTSERIDSALSDHESRLAVLEAFMATLQQQAHQSAAERTDTSIHRSAADYTRPDDFYSTGVQLSRARFEQLKVYAAAHRLEIREAMDMALAAFLAGEGER